MKCLGAMVKKILSFEVLEYTYNNQQEFNQQELRGNVALLLWQLKLQPARLRLCATPTLNQHKWPIAIEKSKTIDNGIHGCCMDVPIYLLML